VAPARVPDAAVAVEAPPSPPGDDSEARAALTAQLDRLVDQCMYDVALGRRRQLPVNANFTPHADGTLTAVRVTVKGADPYLTACLQDAFEGAHLDMSRGVPPGDFHYAFRFRPPAPK
jgi:hypothetical protein